MTTLALAETMTEAIDAIADRLPLCDYLRLRTLAEQADEDSYAMAGVRNIIGECQGHDRPGCTCAQEIEEELRP